jgi:hypothetical protein
VGCNPAYIGTKEVNKKKRTLDQSRPPESQRYRMVDANWPPIVSKETFDKVQLLLGENLRSGHNRADTKKHVYLLQGLVTCGKCSGHMEGRSGTGRLGQRYYFYVCKNRDCGFRVAEKELLKVVLGRIGKIARSPPAPRHPRRCHEREPPCRGPGSPDPEGYAGARGQRDQRPGRTVA